MSTTVAAFLVGYPEFLPLHTEDTAYVTAVLARAERHIGNNWDAVERDDIVYLQTAVNLEQSPMGRNARLSDPKHKSPNFVELVNRKKANAFARSRVV